MMFNVTELFKEYKNIVKTCILDGYALPVLIRDYNNVPVECTYNLAEKDKMYNSLSLDVKYKLGDMLKTRKQIEMSILIGENKDFKNVRMFYEVELNDFLKEYPQFSNIVDE